jgi:hypothetical protein
MNDYAFFHAYASLAPSIEIEIAPPGTLSPLMKKPMQRVRVYFSEKIHSPV